LVSNASVILTALSIAKNFSIRFVASKLPVGFFFEYSGNCFPIVFGFRTSMAQQILTKPGLEGSLVTPREAPSCRLKKWVT